MRTAPLAIFLVSALLGYVVARGGDPVPATAEAGAASQPAAARGPEPETFNTPFWLAPKINPELAPAMVTLAATPDNTVSFDLLQVGNVDPKSFVVTNPAVVPFVTGADTGYSVIPGGLQIGALVYGDRKYTIQQLPAALAGLPLLQTRSGDKPVMDGRYSIVVKSSKPGYVLVALDERALDTYKKYGAPGWLQEFAPTDYKIQTDDPLMAAQNLGFLVFARKAQAGRIALGPPCMDIKFNAMYFAFFTEDK